MAQASLTARRTCRADAKAEHSEPTICFRRSGRLTDKSYPGDNRLVLPKSPYRRQCSAPRCRLNLSWGWRRSQGYGCSPFKKLRELGSDRRALCVFEKQHFSCYKYIFAIQKNVAFHIIEGLTIWILRGIRQQKEEVTVIKYIRLKKVYVWKYIHYI